MHYLSFGNGKYRVDNQAQAAVEPEALVGRFGFALYEDAAFVPHFTTAEAVVHIPAGCLEERVNEFAPCLGLVEVGVAKDYERLPETSAGLHYLVFAMLMLRQFVNLMAHNT